MFKALKRLSSGSTVIAVAAALVFACSGCGKNDSGRVRVFGTVDWNGKPVPSGYVLFRPDPSRDNHGPQGFALIENGRFDTSGESGKGAIPGATLARVAGYTGTNITTANPYGDVQFLPHQLEITIPEDEGEISLVVPDTVPPYAGAN